MTKHSVATLLLAVGCAHAPKSTAPDECGLEAQTRLVQAIADTEPSQRTSALDDLIEKCPEQTTLLQTLLAPTRVTPIEVQLPPPPVAATTPVELLVRLSPAGLSIGDDPTPLERSAWDSQLAERLLQAAGEGTAPVLLIAADPEVIYGDILAVMRTANQVGLTEISFVAPK